MEFKLYLEQQELTLSDINILPNKNTIDTWIDHIRYDVFSLEYEFSRSYNKENYNREYNTVKYVSFEESSVSYNFTKILSHRRPLVLINSSVLTWPALQWDLWDMSINSWRYLENVLSVPIKNESYRDRVIPVNDILYVHSHMSNSLHSSISDHMQQISIFPNKLASIITKPLVIQSLLLIDFLYLIANNQQLHRYFYSTDYKQIESELQVRSSTVIMLFGNIAFSSKEVAIYSCNTTPTGSCFESKIILQKCLIYLNRKEKLCMRRRRILIIPQ